MLFHHRQCSTQPFVLDNRSRRHGLDLVEHPERQRRAFKLNREPAIRIVHHIDLLACQPTRERRWIEQQHHPVVMQGQVVGDRPHLPPGQDLIQIVGRGQRPVQVLGIRRLPPETGVVAGDEARQPRVRRCKR